MKLSKTLLQKLVVGSLSVLILFMTACSSPLPEARGTELFTHDWKFNLGDNPDASNPGFDDSGWRMLNLPHDWSIEGEFSKDNPATPGGGALPGGIAWYRKSFTIPESEKEKLIFIEFDGIYRNSEVWINGHYLGERPYGYISFRYELTPFLKYGENQNIISVKVDNSQQPNSRWYSGSGIYRNVRLVTTEKIYVDHWGTFITTPEVNESTAKVSVKTKIRNSSGRDKEILLRTIILDANGKEVGETETSGSVSDNDIREIEQEIKIENPLLWSVEKPQLYKAVTLIEADGKIYDGYETKFGIRTFVFDAEKGFILNGKQVKIKGVCMHHDLGCLGTAVNTRAIERQLEILKGMGCNGIRTSHNPPAPELLDLCDKMGFIVMDEAFDVWARKKTEYDYSLYWDEWHKRDLEDFIMRDRNHPSVFMWSIGNEVWEQWDEKDTSGVIITKELTAIVKSLDDTRAVTAGCNGTDPSNFLFRANVLDIIGYNYAQDEYPGIPETYPGMPFIATETESSLHTRGHYDMPSDSIRRWPIRWDIPFKEGNPDLTCSSYDNCSAPWGSTHEETWKIIKKYDFISGMFTWTGFDYLGEPTPYTWPARSSYFGIVDLAGFPKDAYYLYQSEWTDKPVLHVFPHWNMPAGKQEGEEVDVWVYTNFEEVELFLNNESLGTKKKTDDELHLMWRVKYVPGTLKAVAKTNDKETLTKEIKTAGEPAKILLEADRDKINADGKDLSFITVKILDSEGNFVPYADNLVNFKIEGEGKIVGVDNGLQTSHESFKTNYRQAFNGMCLVVVQSNNTKGEIDLTAESNGLEKSSIEIVTE